MAIPRAPQEDLLRIGKDFFATRASAAQMGVWLSLGKESGHKRQCSPVAGSQGTNKAGTSEDPLDNLQSRRATVRKSLVVQVTLDLQPSF
jgi:hypothetical protein